MTLRTRVVVHCALPLAGAVTFIVLAAIAPTEVLGFDWLWRAGVLLLTAGVVGMVTVLYCWVLSQRRVLEEVQERLVVHDAYLSAPEPRNGMHSVGQPGTPWESRT